MTDQNDGQEFNDDELQEIMGEIESLEQEFGDEQLEASSQTGSEELDLEETERQLRELEEGDGDDEVEAVEEEVVEAAAEEAVEVVGEQVEPEPEVVEEVVAEEEPGESIEDSISEVDELLAQEESEDEVQEEVMEEAPEEVMEQEVEEVVMQEDHAEEHNVVAMNSTPSGDNTVVLGAEGNMTLNLNFTVAGKKATLKIDGPQLVVEMDGIHFHIDSESGCVFEMPGGVRFEVPLSGDNKVSKAS